MTSTNVGDLVLISSNIVEQAQSGGNYYTQWFGEVENVSSKLYCSVNIKINFVAAAGTMMFNSYADGPPYRAMGLPPGPTIGCIAPGKVGSAYANSFGTTSADIPGATAFQYQLSGTISGTSASSPTYIADSIAPTVTDMLDTNRGDVTGMVTATGPISNIQIRAYAKDAAGLIQAQLVVSDLGSLTAGMSWMFTTPFTQASVVSYVDYATYTDGQ